MPRSEKDIKDEAARKNIPTPPEGYVMSLPPLSGTPAFIKNNVDMGKVRETLDHPGAYDVGAISDVHSDDPTNVRVFDPGMFKPDVLAHEMTHVFQFSRSPAIQAITNQVGQDGVNNATYDYGGVQGLLKARQEGKTIANFGMEQQAEMVRNYYKTYSTVMQKIQEGKATPADLKELAVARQAYHPFIQQLAGMPGVNSRIDPSLLDVVLGRNLPTINTRPAAPGLPPVTTPGLGVAQADPLMGGRSFPIPLPKR